MPWPAPDASRFSSIHSNPPWVKTDRPELVLNRAGKGRALYSASVIELTLGLDATLARLLRMLIGPGRMEVDAPASVEATLFHQPDRHRYVVTLASFQKELPNLPVEGVEVRLRLAPHRVRRITRIPSGASIAMKTAGETVTFKSPTLRSIEMFSVEVT